MEKDETLYILQSHYHLECRASAFHFILGRQNTEIKFNADGDAYGFYNIYQYQRKEEGRFDYILIGTWKEEWVVVFEFKWNSQTLSFILLVARTVALILNYISHALLWSSYKIDMAIGVTPVFVQLPTPTETNWNCVY